MKTQHTLPHILRTPVLAALAFLSFTTAGDAAGFNSSWNGGNGNWDSTTAWTPTGTFPNNGTPAGATYDVLAGSGGTITLANQDITIERFTLNGFGTLTGAFNITANGLFDWASGTLSGSGAFNANGGISMANNAGGGAGLTITQRTVNVPSGQTTVMSGGPNVQLAFNTGAVFNNSGTFLAQNNRGFAGTGTFNNLAGGTFTRNTGTGDFTITIPFINAGSVNVQTGRLVMGATSGSSSGSFDVSNGATLNFLSNYTLDATSTITGTGVLLLNGATLDNAGTVNIANLTLSTGGNLSGSALQGTGVITVSGVLDWNAGTIAGGTSGGLVDFNADGNISIAQFTNNLNRRRLILAPGKTATVVNAGAGISFSNGAIFRNNGTFLAQNNITRTGTQGLTGGTGGSFENIGTFTREVGTSKFAATVQFKNTGVVNVNSGSLYFGAGDGGSTTGTFNVASGATLAFGGNQRTDHTEDRIFGGDFTLDASSVVTGQGTVEFGAKTVVVGGTFTVPAVNVIGGDATVARFNVPITVSSLGFYVGPGAFVPRATITGTGVITCNGPFVWVGGSLIGEGASVVPFNANGGVTLTDFGGTLDHRNLIIPAGQTFSIAASQTIADFALVNSAVVNNAGAFIAQNNGRTFTINTGCTFNNTGTFTRNVGTGSYTVNGGGAFDNTGTVNANSGTLAFTAAFTQTTAGAVLNLGGGNVSTGGTLAINGGSVTGSGTISGNVAVTSAKVSPAGTVAVSGDLTVTSASTLEIDINGTAAGTGYDVITEGGGTAFVRNGTLLVRLPGAFVPANGNSFNILTSSHVMTSLPQFSNVISGRVNAVDSSDNVIGSFAINAGTFFVTLNDYIPLNHPPVIAADNAARTVNEGTQITNSGTFSDPDGNGTVTLSASVGTVVKDNAAGTWSWSLTPADNASSSTVTITATDAGSPVLTATATFNLTVNDVAPTLALSGPNSIGEGVSYSLALGSVIDPGADTVSSYTINWGDGTTPETFSGAPSLDKVHTFANGSAGGTVRTISVTLVNEDGTFPAAGTKTITVNNTAPTVSPQSRTILEDSGATTFTLTAMEPGTNDTVTFAIATPPPAAEGTLSAITVIDATSASVTFTPAANFFGSTSFTYTATDNDGDASSPATISLTVTSVNDAPTLDAIPGPVSLTDNAAQQTVNLTGISMGAANEAQSLAVTATSDNTAVIPDPTVNYTPSAATGSIAYQPVANAVGTAHITVTVTDSGDTSNGGQNTTSRSFTVNVVDTTPPVLTVPAPIITEATGPTGKTVTFAAATATDAVTTSPTITYEKVGNLFAFGPTLFPLGTTTVTVTATDAAGNATTRDFDVTVRDTTPPAITVPANISVVATSPAGAAVTFSISATDLVDGVVTATPDHASGSVFPISSSGTVVEVIAQDAAGNSASRSFTVKVTGSPEIVVEEGGHELEFRRGGVSAWGLNNRGQTTVPANLTDAIAIAAGRDFTMALKGDGTVVAWGYNGFGQNTIPTNLIGVSAIAAGESEAVAIKNDGSVVAWGANIYGMNTVPANLTDVQAIAAGWRHIVALKSDGTVVAWGSNFYGQTTVPANLTGVQAIATASQSTVALKSNGTVVAWGYNLFGQTNVPANLTAVQAIAAGGDHVLALKIDGTIVAWGSNTFGESTVPSNLTGVVAIAAGDYHSVAQKSDGTVVAWGYSGFGQTTSPANLAGVTAISAGGNHTVALSSTAIPTLAYGAGTVGSATAKTLTLRNTGTTALSLSGVSVTGANASDFVPNTSELPSSIAPGASATFSLTFTPSAASSRAATLLIANNDSDESPYEISLTGSGNAPPTLTLPASPIIVQATSGSGAVVTFSVSTTDAEDDPEPVATATPASGSTFALGDTTVNVTTTDAGGATTTGSFIVRVVDTISPVITLNGSNPLMASATSAAGAMLSFPAATATDAVTTSPTITYSKDGTVFPFGPTLFPIGVTTVTVTATDVAGNVSTSSFTVDVSDQSLPVVAAHLPVTVEATGPTGAIVTYTPATATDPIITSATPLIITYSKASGALFPVGTTNVIITATDEDGNAGTGSFAVNVVDTTPPVLSANPSVIAEATSPMGATVVFPAATATDEVTTSPTITYAKGGTVFAFGPTPFPLGTTTVTATATDAAGNASTSDFDVIVQDTTPPEITVPANIVVAATSAAGAAVTFSVSATDLYDGVVTATPDHASGSIFPISATATLVEVTAQDAAGNSASQSFTVRVTGSPEIVVEEGGHELLMQTGIVSAWGDNSSGLGNVPANLSNVQAIAAGALHTVALKSDGAIVAWGDNSFGQTTVPANLAGVQAIAAGAQHTVALRSNGTVVAWGKNSNGQTTVPTNLTGVQAISASGHHTVALKSDGTVVAWGNNHDGESTVPANLTGVQAISAGGYHTVALKSDGTVVAWGSNGAGQTTVPANLAGVQAIWAGNEHTVVLKSDGTVVAWGNNLSGQSTVPANLTGVIAISAGVLHTVALKSDGTVVGWGNNSDGQITMPANLTGVTAIAARTNHTIALSSRSIPTLAFGSRLTGSATTKTITLRNTGTAPLTLGGVSVLGANASDFVPNASGLPSSLAPGASATFDLTFTPSAASSRAATLRIVNNDSDENPFGITLTGNGNTPPTLTLPASPLIVQASSASGAVVTFSVSATDAEDDPEPVATATPASGSNFAMGDTTVNVTTTDAGGATTTGSFVVRVDDSAGPVITINGSNPASIAPGSTYTDAGATAVDAVNGSLAVTSSGFVNTGKSGSYSISYSATDARGNRTLARRTVIVLAPGAADPVYHPVIVGTGVIATAVQADGKLLIGGLFTSVDGVARTNLARLNVDGTLDTGFDPTASGGDVKAIAVQTDGKIIIGGSFTTVRGVARNRIARLNSDGTLDTAFNPNCDGTIRCLALQFDGKILVGGLFSNITGVAKSNLARLTTSGAADVLASGTTGAVSSIAVQTDGKILLGGDFSMIGTKVRNRVGRLTATGALDAAFNPNANGSVSSIAVQADGQVLLGGSFTALQPAKTAIPRNRIARVSAAGVVDTSFNPNADAAVSSIVLQADAAIVLGGAFNQIGVNASRGVARLTATGMLDTSYSPGLNGAVAALSIQVDGKVIIAGGFSQVGSFAASGIARLLNTAATQQLTVPDTSRVVWMRGGTSPEATFVTFESSTNNGATWTMLAKPTRIAGGWQLSNPGLPTRTDALLRARASTAGGTDAGSAGLVESIANYRTSAATAISGLASAILSRSAIVAGSVNAHGTEAATIRFEYGLSTSYANSVPALPATASGTRAVNASATLSSLEPNATYHYRVKATTASGVAYGDDMTFTTMPEGGALSFATTTLSINRRTASGQLNTFPVSIHRRGGTDGEVAVEVTAQPPATVPTGSIKYVYGTHYVFATETSAGKTVVVFNDGQQDATVMVRMLSTTATANGVFQLALGSVAGEVLVEAPATTTVTVINDTTAPVITVTLPGTIGSSITVTGTVNENIALSSFTATLNGVTQTFAVNPMSAFVAGAAIPFSLTGLLPENGSNRLVIEGTDTSGNLTSVVKTFTYTMSTVLISGNYRALLSPVGPASAANSGMVSVTLANNGSFTGKVDFMNASIPFSGLLRTTGAARFQVSKDLEETFDLADQTDFDQFFGALSFSIDRNQTNGLQGSLTTQATNGSAIATFGAQASHNRIPADVLNQPSGGTFNKGVYAVVISSKLQSPSRAADSYPQGDGVASLTVTGTGVTLAGTLADGAAFTATSDYRTDRSTPIFVPLYGAKGFLTGTVTYTNLADSDVNGINLQWFRPAVPAARYYPAGWPSGITIDAVGTKFDGGSGDLKHKTLNFGQGPTSMPGGNARLSFTEGRLTAPIDLFMSINPDTGVSVRISQNYTFDPITSTGLFSGTNTHDGVTDIYRGALLNKGGNRGGFGYFLSTPPNVVGGPGESGNISLVPLVP